MDYKIARFWYIDCSFRTKGPMVPVVRNAETYLFRGVEVSKD
jgi:hypothetical protein